LRSDRERLLDIVEAIERVERYAARGEDAFTQDELVQTWMLRHLQVIGEAARAMSEGFRAAHPEIPWSAIIGTRTILVHRYFQIDLALLWLVVEREIPALKASISDILNQEPGTP